MGDQPVTARLQLDAATYGIRGPRVRIATVNKNSPLPQAGEGTLVPSRIERELTFPARSAFAWELRPAEGK